MKIGDKVRRLKEFQRDTWAHGNSVLTVTKISSAGTAINIAESKSWWDTDRFEIIHTSSLEDQIAQCENIVGKKVEYLMDGVVEELLVTEFLIISKFNDISAYSRMVSEALIDSTAVVVLFGNHGENIPFTAATSIKEYSITVKLNEAYSAEVTKNSIKVGCQIFPINVLDKLNDAYQKL